MATDPWTMVSEPSRRIAVVDSYRDGFFHWRRPPWIRMEIVSKYQAVMAAVIFLNAVFIGIEAEWKLAHQNQESPPTFRGVSILFTCIFTVELVMNLVYQQMYYFSRRSPDFWWNAFDAVIVFLCLVDEIILVAGVESSNLSDVSALRLLRIMRLVRIMRIIRAVRFVKDLRVMVQGIMASMQSILWALVVLLLIMYTFTISIAVSMEALLGDVRAEGDYLDAELAALFGSVTSIMCYLFMCITGGIDWHEVALPLTRLSPFYGVGFAFYIALSVFAVFNVITGVFVENSTKLVHNDEDDMIMDELESRQQWYTSIEKIFNKMDHNGNGSIEREDFLEMIKDKRAQALFTKLGFPVTPENAPGIFGMLDFDGDGGISYAEFEAGVYRLHGGAKSIDMAKLLVRVDQCAKGMEELMRGLLPEDQLAQIQPLKSRKSLLTGKTASLKPERIRYGK